MKWFCKATLPDGEHIFGPYSKEEADAVVAKADAEGEKVEALEAEDDYLDRTRVIHLATITRGDGVFRIYSDGHEEREEG